MSIRVVCSGCDGQLTVGDEMAGKKVRCGKCAAVVVVPAAISGIAEAEVPRSSWRIESTTSAPKAPTGGMRAGPPPKPQRVRDEDEREEKRDRKKTEERLPKRERKQASKGIGPGLLIGGGVGVVVVVVGIVAVLMLGGGGNKTPDEPAAKLEPADPVVHADPIKRDPVVDPKTKAPPLIEPPRVAGPLPAAIEPAKVQAVKKSTVFMRVRLPGGGMAEGSGFFAFRPGIVLTNAHVLGMLNADARRPLDVKAVLNSGEPDESILPAQILGVDRHSDLAVLRVPGDPARLPPPLPVAKAKDLIELQKVYIFGFPFGSKLGKNISVSESSISSIRKNDEGIIEKVQVNGGMHPGNSGGPVVDARGHVVGVSVSVIRGTTINFAVPGELVHVILDGRILEFGIDPPYREGAGLTSNVRLVCIDPLQRIQDAKVEVWVGAKGSGLKTSTVRPVDRPGDSPRQSFAIKLRDGQGEADVPLPPLDPDKAYYFQPVLTNGAGETRWSPCMPYLPPPFEPFERKAVDLRQKFSVPQRTLFMKSSSKIKIPDTEKTHSLTFAMEMDLSEQVRTSGGSAAANVGYLRARMGIDIDGKAPARSSRMQRALEGLTYVTQDITIDGFGNLKRSMADYNKVPPSLREDAAELHDQVAESLEALTIPTPNRVVNPRETWTGTKPLLLFNDGKAEVAQMEIVYTYDGCRKRDGKDEAWVSFSGVVKGRTGRESSYGGKVEGTALFDLDAGYISHARVDVSFDTDLKLTDETIPAIGTLNAEIRRSPGLLVAKETPRPGPGPVGGIRGIVQPLARSKSMIQQTLALTPGDFPDNVGRGRAKVIQVKMRKGKEYQVDVIAKGFDPVVRVETGTAKVLAVDDDGGGGLDSRLIFRCPADGIYRIVVTSFGPNQFGVYQLLVKEGF